MCKGGYRVICQGLRKRGWVQLDYNPTVKAPVGAAGKKKGDRCSDDSGDDSDGDSVQSEGEGESEEEVDEEDEQQYKLLVSTGTTCNSTSCWFLFSIAFHPSLPLPPFLPSPVPCCEKQ